MSTINPQENSSLENPLAWEDRYSPTQPQKVSKTMNQADASKLAHKLNNSGQTIARIAESRQFKGQYRVIVDTDNFNQVRAILYTNVTSERPPATQTITPNSELQFLDEAKAKGTFPVAYEVWYYDAKLYEKEKKIFEQLKKEGFNVSFDNKEQVIALGEPKMLLQNQYPLGERALNPDFCSSVRGVDGSIAKKRESNLLDQARKFFSDHKFTDDMNLEYKLDSDSKTEKEALEIIFNKYQGFCLGERYHPQDTAKRFLMQNMQTLKELGVTTLFMEFLCYDSLQDQLDQYLKSPEHMPEKLSTTLDLLNRGHMSVSCALPDHNYRSLVEAAVKAGIRVVGLDTTVSDECGWQAIGGAGGEDRMLGMNYVAKDIIAREKGEGKYLAFFGASHLTLCDNVPGLPAIIGTPWSSI